MIIALRYALCAMRASLLSVGTDKIKSQDRFRFDGRQPTNVDFTPGQNSMKASLTPNISMSRWVTTPQRHTTRSIVWLN